ncbi:flavin monoamine oxidase family protein [Chryseobacterium wanjuense]
MIPSSSFANFILSGKKKVIVIGAGFSGLAAANKLNQRNFDVTVLESQNRIGGRVFSHEMNGDLVVELGAEWVGNSHNRILELCNELKLELSDNQMDTHLLYKGVYSPARQWDFSKNWKLKMESLLENYRHLNDKDKLTLDKMDWWRYLVNNGCKDRDLDLRELMDSTDFGESIRKVSANAALSEYVENAGDTQNQMDKKIIGGNTMLAQRLSEKLGKEKYC